MWTSPLHMFQQFLKDGQFATFSGRVSFTNQTMQKNAFKSVSRELSTKRNEMVGLLPQVYL
jgi:hypothetical protein